MKNIDLSIIIPGIRPHRWQRVEESVAQSCQCFEYEIIFIGPRRPKNLGQHSRFIKDFGSANRCQQIGATEADGKYILAAADDGVFRDEELDKILDVAGENDEKTVISTKYTEGDGQIHGDHYYRLCNAYPSTPYIPQEWWIFNSALINRKYFNHLGGWDASLFAVPCLAHADLAARAQRDGCKVVFYDTPIIDCEHMPGTSGDHAPIHYAHLEEEQLYRRLYSSPDCQSRISIPLDSWKQAPAIWEPRFKDTANV
jgi:GT2 family glycosyltransferase